MKKYIYFVYYVKLLVVSWNTKTSWEYAEENDEKKKKKNNLRFYAHITYKLNRICIYAVSLSIYIYNKLYICINIHICGILSKWDA